MSIWSNVRAVLSGLCLLGLLAWCMIKQPPPKEYVDSCKAVGGVVAYTAMTNEKVCVKPTKEK